MGPSGLVSPGLVGSHMKSVSIQHAEVQVVGFGRPLDVIVRMCFIGKIIHGSDIQGPLQLPEGCAGSKQQQESTLQQPPRPLLYFSNLTRVERGRGWCMPLLCALRA